MRSTTRWILLLSLSASGFALGVACDNEDIDSTSDVPLFDSTGEFPDTSTSDTSAPRDTLPAQDTLLTQDTSADTAVPDLIPDLTAPTIVSTSPSDGETNVAIPFAVTITFDEAVYAPTIASQTIKLIDFNGDEVAGTPSLSADGTVVTFALANNDQQYASPYTIRVVGNIITDLAGNKLINTEEFTFTTANYPQQDSYRAIAEKYAPTIYSAVDNGFKPETQVPTKIDSDGDLDLSNNRDWLIQTTSIVPALYYNVVDTQTHYFIQYMLYFPWVNHETGAYAHANGAVGYLVTVEKARGAVAERPIALHTYYRENTAEENLAFVTNESGIIGGGLGTDDWSVEAAFDQADLFPGDRFEAYITAKNHRACLWSYEQDGFLPACQLTSAIKNGDKLVFSYKGGAPGVYQKGESGWPADMAAIEGTPETLGYALIPALTALWPHRFEQGAHKLFEIGTFSYGNDAGRPVGADLELTSKFLDPLGSSVSAYGRPLWAWGWSPAIGQGPQSGFANISRGEIAIDPAWYVWERHHSSVTVNSLIDYNGTTGVGWSTDYCFNGFANIDNRATDPKCQ